MFYEQALKATSKCNFERKRSWHYISWL